MFLIFIANSRPWVTICDAYLHKFFTVDLCSVEQMEADDEIQEIVVDFEEFASSVQYHMIPLWNLTPTEEKTSTYPTPCWDKLHYEHRIFSHRLKAESKYLVANTEVEISEIRRLHGDLVITCPEENPYPWNLLQVAPCPAKVNYLYPPLSNQVKASFADDLSEVYRKSVKTKAEVARLVNLFSYGDKLTYDGLVIREEPPAKEQSYDMDAFISDELRVGDHQQTMLLSFTAVHPGDYLNHDVMSFLVTQVQKLFPEYHCCGQLI